MNYRTQIAIFTGISRMNKWIRNSIVFLVLMLLAGCATVVTRDGPPKRSVDVTRIPDAKPTALQKSRYGNPKFYVVKGKRYHVLQNAQGYTKRGIASWYGTKFQGKLTSTREPYDLFSMTAASPELPIPCYARVTNLENNKSIIVKVNDRGPFAPNRILDLSYVAAKKLGYASKGTAMVEVAVVDPSHPSRAPARQELAHPKLYLQLGAFTSHHNAENFRTKVSHFTRREVRIETTRGKHHEFYRVQIGPLMSVDESDSLQQKLTAKGLGHAYTVIG